MSAWRWLQTTEDGQTRPVSICRSSPVGAASSRRARGRPRGSKSVREGSDQLRIPARATARNRGLDGGTLRIGSLSGSAHCQDIDPTADVPPVAYRYDVVGAHGYLLKSGGPHTRSRKPMQDPKREYAENSPAPIYGCLGCFGTSCGRAISIRPTLPGADDTGGSSRSQRATKGAPRRGAGGRGRHARVQYLHRPSAGQPATGNRRGRIQGPQNASVVSALRAAGKGSNPLPVRSKADVSSRRS